MLTLVFVLLGIVVFIMMLVISFRRWKKSVSLIMEEGNIFETTRWRIHYKLIGEGPVLFFMHGGPGGNFFPSLRI
jgi:hypothetical protein